MDDKPSGRFSVQSPAQTAARSLADLRSEAASARALLDMLERRLPAPSEADGAAPPMTAAIAEQLSEELARLAAELIRCARRLAPDLRRGRVDDDDHDVDGASEPARATPGGAGRAA